MKYKIRKDLKLKFKGRILYRIEALKSFSNVKKGDLGGYIEGEYNLSQNGDCWIYEPAAAYDDSLIFGDALVYDNAKVYGNAKVFDKARVYCDAKVFDGAEIFGNAHVYNNAKVFGIARVADYAGVRGYAKVFGTVRVYNNARVDNSMKISKFTDLIYITGVRHDITLTLTGMNVGCEHYKDLKDFMSRVKDEAVKAHYTEIEKKHLIATIKNGIKLLKSYK